MREGIITVCAKSADASLKVMDQIEILAAGVERDNSSSSEITRGSQTNNLRAPTFYHMTDKTP